MAQAAAVSGTSASESSWGTASDISSPAHSTGCGRLARLPPTPARREECSADVGDKMAAGSVPRNTTRGKAVAVTTKRKADAGATEDPEPPKRRGGWRALWTTSAERTSLEPEGGLPKDVAPSGKDESSDAFSSSDVVPADKSITECNAVDMCQNWSPCYVSNPPKWVNGITDIIMGSIVGTAIIPYAAICIMVFRRARAASYYLVRLYAAAVHHILWHDVIGSTSQ